MDLTEGLPVCIVNRDGNDGLGSAKTKGVNALVGNSGEGSKVICHNLQHLALCHNIGDFSVIDRPDTMNS